MLLTMITVLSSCVEAIAGLFWPKRRNRANLPISADDQEASGSNSTHQPNHQSPTNQFNLKRKHDVADPFAEHATKKLEIVEDEKFIPHRELALPKEDEEKYPRIFGKSLADFGYAFDENGELRDVKTGGRFEFAVSPNRDYNQARYEALGLVS